MRRYRLINYSPQGSTVSPNCVTPFVTLEVLRGYSSVNFAGFPLVLSE